MPGYVALHSEWFQIGLKAPELATLVSLLSFEGEKGCFPSHKTIAKRAGCSVSSVRRALDRLEEMGRLERVTRSREDGSQSSNTYRIHMPDSIVDLEHPPAHREHPPTQGEQGPPAHREQPSTIPNDEDEQRRGPSAQSVVDKWNGLARQHNLPTLRKPPVPSMLKKFRARLADNPDLWDLLAVELRARSKFHVENRYPTFSQVCRPEYLESILNGEKRGKNGSTVDPERERINALKRELRNQI